MACKEGAAVAGGGVNLAAVSFDDLLAELGRRGHSVALSGSIGALHDHLERTGALDGDSKQTAYLVYRVRRDDYLCSPSLPPQERRRMAAIWQEKIDSL